MRYIILVWLSLLAAIPAAAQTLELGPGWNAVGFQCRRVASLSSTTAVAQVATYEGGSYRTGTFSADTVNAGAGTLRGFWVYATSNANVTYAAAEGSTTPMTLSAGWNLVSFPEAVSGAALRVRRDGQEVSLTSVLLGTFYQLASDGTSTPVSIPSGALSPGRACWVFANAPCELSWSQTASTSVLHVAIFTHNEDPHHPAYPDFVADKNAYKTFRAGLLEFAREMRNRNLAWNWQSDWNFLNAVIRYEVEERDAELLGATGGQNVVVYLRDLGVEIDPHSHENDGYNYADVAYLLTQCGVQPSAVVGGHIYDPNESGYQNWPRFANGLPGSKYPGYTWKPTLLAGTGTGSHRRDPAVSGMWRPASPTDYFTHSTTGTMVSFGGWDGKLERVGELLRLLEGGALPAGMATASFMFNQSDLATSGYLQSTVIPQLDTLVSLRDQGRLRVVKFEEALSLWNGTGSVYPTGNDMLSFSLNVQDFAYPDRSAALLTKALDLHERLKVPVDVFLTTTQVDLFASSLLERLKNSRLVTVSYHNRAPKPYANNYDWLGLASLPLTEQVNTIRNYETHGLDLVTGQPTAAEGGYARLKNLLGYAPMIIGSGEPTLFQASAQVFAEMGASLAVEHSGTVNLGQQRYGLALRPEHVDLRLFETGYTGQSGQTIVETAVTQARAASGATAPYFTGVKMHDNDFFAVDSAWLTVYLNGGRRTPPWDTNRKSALLSEAEQAEMWARYEAVVTYAASVRSRINLVSAPVIRAMQPQR